MSYCVLVLMNSLCILSEWTSEYLWLYFVCCLNSIMLRIYVYCSLCQWRKFLRVSCCHFPVSPTMVGKPTECMWPVSQVAVNVQYLYRQLYLSQVQVTCTSIVHCTMFASFTATWDAGYMHSVGLPCQVTYEYLSFNIRLREESSCLVFVVSDICNLREIRDITVLFSNWIPLHVHQLQYQLK